MVTAPAASSAKRPVRQDASVPSGHSPADAYGDHKNGVADEGDRPALRVEERRDGYQSHHSDHDGEQQSLTHLRLDPPSDSAARHDPLEGTHADAGVVVQRSPHVGLGPHQSVTDHPDT